MPAWLLAALIKYGVPLALQLLEKTGALNEAEALIVRGYVATKTYPDYPSQDSKGQPKLGS